MSQEDRHWDSGIELPEEAQSAQCLFCDNNFAAPKLVFDHCTAQHKWDVAAARRDVGTHDSIAKRKASLFACSDGFLHLDSHDQLHPQSSEKQRLVILRALFLNRLGFLSNNCRNLGSTKAWSCFSN